MLLLDVGNSRCKWALVQHGAWVRQGVAGNTEWIAMQQAFASLPPPARILVSNVAGAAMLQRLRDVCAAWPVAPEVVEASAVQCGVRNGYAEPTKLGSDRWLAMIAARQQVPQGEVLVVSCGTATTVDALSAQGDFLGGLILPGLDMMRDSLLRDTFLTGMAVGEVRDFPLNTADAIQSGRVQATLGAIHQQYKKLVARAGEVTVLLDGGASEVLLPYMEIPVQPVTGLVLKGLQIVGERCR